MRKKKEPVRFLPGELGEEEKLSEVEKLKAEIARLKAKLAAKDEEIVKLKRIFIN